VLNLNASTVNVTSSTGVTLTGTGFTLNAGTSQINFTSNAGPNITTNGTAGSPRVFYNVTTVTSFAGTTDISGVNTFNNLTIGTASNAEFHAVVFSADQTINGTLAGSGPTAIARLFYRSSVLGTPRTLTLANPTTLTNCDFRDITAGTNAITATGGGDCGGNTNITFPSPKTVY
jgi:hypothetical protein